jgi:hypothetical protein
MLFRQQAINLIGKSVQLQTTSGRILTGHMSSVGTNFLTMRVRIGNRNRRIIIRLAEIILLFSLPLKTNLSLLDKFFLVNL